MLAGSFLAMLEAMIRPDRVGRGKGGSARTSNLDASAALAYLHFI
jgi:hypothetical protein